MYIQYNTLVSLPAFETSFQPTARNKLVTVATRKEKKTKTTPSPTKKRDFRIAIRLFKLSEKTPPGGGGGGGKGGGGAPGF